MCYPHMGAGRSGGLRLIGISQKRVPQRAGRGGGAVIARYISGFWDRVLQEGEGG